MPHPVAAPNDSELRSLIADFPDFPKPGIMFRDMSPLLRRQFPLVVERMSALFSPQEWTEVDYIAGIESRGFILAAALAARHGKGYVPIRKAGKLPGKTARAAYGLEYGAAELEMHYGDGTIFLVDDVLATGGTLAAAADLAVATGHKVAAIGVLIDLPYLNSFQWNGQSARSVIRYEA